MRLLVILALVAACGHKSAPTTEWCQSYLGELRSSATAHIHQLTLSDANRRRGAEDLRALVGTDPAISVAFKVCSDAVGDSPASAEARSLKINDLHYKIADYVAVHAEAGPDEAQVKELAQMFEQLASTYSDPPPP